MQKKFVCFWAAHTHTHTNTAHQLDTWGVRAYTALLPNSGWIHFISPYYPATLHCCLFYKEPCIHLFYKEPYEYRAVSAQTTWQCMWDDSILLLDSTYVSCTCMLNMLAAFWQACFKIFVGNLDVGLDGGLPLHTAVAHGRFVDGRETVNENTYIRHQRRVVKWMQKKSLKRKGATVCTWKHIFDVSRQSPSECVGEGVGQI